MKRSSFKPLNSDELQGLINAWAEDHAPYSKHKQNILGKIKSNILCWMGEAFVGLITCAIIILMASADSWPI